MIHKLVLKNFKRIKEEVFEFGPFELIVGANNSGKSTILQALAIWQYCVDQFGLSKRKGSRGIQIVLPNFTALPLPEFNLLWNERMAQTARSYVYIEIDVYWRDQTHAEQHFCVQMRYQSAQAAFAIPKEGWDDFASKLAMPGFPRMVYVPPFSGLEPHEPWMDDGNIRQKIGKAQPGAVLRNLLYRVVDKEKITAKHNPEWQEIASCIKNWFDIDLQAPLYEKGISVEITAEYKFRKKSFDIIAGGSGFHQILTLLAFVYGYPEASVILLDEPDAHLHVNLQRKIIGYFKATGQKQFLIATHSEEFVKGVEISSVLSLLSGRPRRTLSSSHILHAMSDVDNQDVVRTEQSPYILYIEGEDDERLLSAWASTLGQTNVYERFYPYVLGGSSKKDMSEKANRHFNALREIVPQVKRAILLDQDGEENALNPPADNLVMNEWKRKNIDNYLLVPNAWKRAVIAHLNCPPESPLCQPYLHLIDEYFSNENLTLPPNARWKTVSASIFKVLDGKKLLFENKNSLFEQIKEASRGEIRLNRSNVARNMEATEIHQDIERFFSNLERIVSN